MHQLRSAKFSRNVTVLFRVQTGTTENYNAIDPIITSCGDVINGIVKVHTRSCHAAYFGGHVGFRFVELM